jgi:hypothetical protein
VALFDQWRAPQTVSARAAAPARPSADPIAVPDPVRRDQVLAGQA